MNIVQICPYNIDRPGGVQRHVLALAACLRAFGHNVLIVAPGPKSGESDDIYYVGRQREIGMSGTRFELTWAAPQELRRLFKHFHDWKADLLHFHSLWTPLMPFQIFKRWGGPVIVTFHDTPPPGIGGDVLRLLFKAMSRWILARIDGAIAVSQAPMMHLYPGSGGVVPIVIPPAVDIAMMTAGSAKRKTDSASLRFLFVGRLERRKGISELLRAWDAVQQSPQASACRFKLTIAGKGKLSAMVKEAEHKQGRDRLEFIEAPADSELKQLYSEADIFVAPSPFGESFGIVLLEAMANGVPVIAAANAGYVNVMTGPAAQGLVPPGDINALAGKMLQFAEDKNLRLTLAASGPQHAAHYDIRVIAPQIEDIYRSALAFHQR
jgi:glycosyltransferase involved in cell wall biosynthesis